MRGGGAGTWGGLAVACALALATLCSGGTAVARSELNGAVEIDPLTKTYKIEGRIKLPPRETIKPTSMRVAVNGGEYVGVPRSDGTFIVYGVPPGKHYLEVFATGLQFPQLRVRVKAPGTVQAKLVEETSGGNGKSFGYPLLLEPRGRVQYFQQHQQISIMRMIMGNPTVLMMGFMGLMAWGLPKMMENMDPEELAKMQEDMKENPMQQMLSGTGGGGGGGGGSKKKEAKERSE